MHQLSIWPLNVLIGPNASGKSNLIEAIELLHATPTKFAAAIQDGGGVHEWLWKGDRRERAATIEAVLTGEYPIPDLRYRLAFAAAGQRIEVVDEVLEETAKRYANEADLYFYYRYQAGRPVINTCQATTTTTPPPTTTTTTGPQLVNTRAFRQLTRDSLVPDESVLSQRKDPELYPKLTWLGRRFDGIQTFREWSASIAAAHNWIELILMNWTIGWPSIAWVRFGE
jgi:predicted ATPase